MFEYDICLCMSKCPFKDECVRGQKHGPGIFTMADFYKDNYTKAEDCKDYIPMRKEN